MKKVERFYRMLVAQAELQMQIRGVRVVYFTKNGSVLDNETNECKWWVCDGVVHDNEERVSCRAEKYSANLGMLY